MNRFRMTKVLSEAASYLERVYAEPKEQVIPEEALRQAEDWAQVAERLGIEPDAPLGTARSGTMGTVYMLDSKRVVKFSADDSEAAAMFQYLGEKSKYVVQVHDLFSFKMKGADFYAIVEERVGPAEQSWMDFADVAHFYFIETNKMAFTSKAMPKFATWIEQIGRGPPASTILTLPEQKTIPRKRGGARPQASIVQAEDPNANEPPWPSDKRTPTTEQMEWLREAIKDLEAHKVVYWDLHGDNIMRRGGDHVIIDLGESDVSGATSIPSVRKVPVAMMAKAMRDGLLE